MLDKILVGTAVWLASNNTGRKVARRGASALNKLGGRIVRAMPKDLSDIFVGVDDVLKDLASDETTNRREGT